MSPGELVLTDAPATRRAWFDDLRRHLPVLGMLARKDFQTRYKRATFGVLWAVGLPLLQAAVMGVVFAKVARFELASVGYGIFVLAGMVVWGYFAGTVGLASTAIVDGAGLTDKVWFPRATLVLVPVASNLVGLTVSVVALLALTPLLDGELGPRTLLLLPAIGLAVALAATLGLVLAALYVYFRDVKFLVQAALLVWLYVTPIIYPRDALGAYAGWLDWNPLTGIVALVHAAVGVEGEPVLRPVLVSLSVTAVLAVAAVEAHRRHDRLFVDQL